jgi:hypothetical protein
MGRSAQSVINGSKSGVLYKQGHKVRNWKRRWFSLCGTSFPLSSPRYWQLTGSFASAEKRLYYFDPAHTGVRLRNVGVNLHSLIMEYY